MPQQQELVRLLEGLTVLAREKGCTHIRYYIDETKELYLNVYRQKLDRFVQSETVQYLMEANVGGLKGATYFEDPSPALFPQIVERLCATAAANGDPFLAKPFAGTSNPAEELPSADPAAMTQLLQQADQLAYSLDTRIENVNYCMFSQTQQSITLLDEAGNTLTDRTGSYFCEVDVVARACGETGKPEVQTAFAEQYTRQLSEINPAQMARKAVERVLAQLHAGRAPSAGYPVLLENQVAGQILSAFLPVFFAETMQRGMSILAGKQGETIAAPLLTLTEEPTLPGGILTRSFDDEGVPTSRSVLIDKGVFQGALYNHHSAEQDGVSSTGNGFKRQYRDTCTTLVTNLLLAPGQTSFDDLVAHMGHGVVITSVDGLHAGVQAASGTFSLIAKGFLVEDGKLSRPLAGITVGGTLLGLLQGIEEIGSDLSISSDGSQFLYTPSLRIKQLNIAGE